MKNKEANEKYIVDEEIEFLGSAIGERFIEPKQQIAGYESLSVKLLTPTANTAYADWVNAACYASLVTWDATPHIPATKMESCVFEEREKRLLAILKKRPISVALEGVVFSFKIIGIPRAMTHQIVRHRQMAFGQQSYRVSSCYSDPVRAPQTLFDAAKVFEDGVPLNPKTIAMLDNYATAVKKCRQVYKQLIENGIPMEQARCIMPMGTCTKIVATMRLRDFIDYVKGRTSDITQDEHTYIVCLMLQELKEKQPNFYEVVKMFVPKAEETMQKYLGDANAISKPKA